MNTVDEPLKEITRKTEALAGHANAPSMKHREIHRLRTIPTPLQRKAVKNGYDFVGDSRDENLEIWDYIWKNSAYMEVMNQALYFYQHRELNKAEVTSIRGWTARCTCWEHSDDLTKIYADVVESNPGWMLPTLKKWNRSGNSWQRRKSMTSLIEYAAKRKHFLPFRELITFIEPLLDDDEYYVQKGLGWTLREIGNAYPGETSVFMEKHAARLSPLAWTGATRKLSKAEKQKLKRLRAARRTNP